MRYVKEVDKVLVIDVNSFAHKDTQDINSVVYDAKYKLTLKPSYTIVELRENSPAAKAGLMVGDIILIINGKPSYQFLLQDLMHKFYDKDGTRIKLIVERNGKELSFVFNLEKLFE